MFTFILFIIAVITFIRVQSQSERIKILEDKVRTGNKVASAPVPLSSDGIRPVAPMPPVSSVSEVQESTVEALIHQNTTPIPQKVVTHVSSTHATSTQDSGEFAFGSRVITGVGVLAIFLGVGFFLRYAFENNLIGEGTRVLLGALLGLILLSIGHFLREKYQSYGYTLIGAGFGILYLSIYSAYDFYALISAFTAFVLLILATLLSVGASLYYNSRALVSYSFLGAFLIPFILPLFLSVHGLFIYLIILNTGVLIIARFKAWPELTLATIFATVLIYIRFFFGGGYTPEFRIETLAYVTLIFLIYFMTSLLNFVYRDRDYKGIDGVLLYGIPILYFVVSLGLVFGKESTALLMLSIGLFYVIVGIIIRAGFLGVGELNKFSNILFAIGAPFFASATAVHFEGSFIAIMWALQAVVMIGIGYGIDTKANRVGGLIMYLFSAMSALFTIFDLGKVKTFVFNERFFTLLFVACAGMLIWWLYRMIESKNPSHNKEEILAGRFIGSFVACLSLLVSCTLEIIDSLPNAHFYLPLFFAVSAALIVSLSFILNEKCIRFIAYILLPISMLMFFIVTYDITALDQPQLFNIRVFTALIHFLVTGYIVFLFKTHEGGASSEERNIVLPLVLSSQFMIFYTLTREVSSFFESQISTFGDQSSLQTLESTKRVVLSIAWLVYAGILLTVGIVKRSSTARYLSLVLLAVTVVKIFLYDTARLSDIYRFVSFITLGVILLIAGFAYYRFKDRISLFVTAGDTKTH